MPKSNPARTSRIVCILLVTLASAAGSAQEAWTADAEGRASQDRRWIPGLSGFGAGIVQDRQGSTDTTEFGRDMGESRGVTGLLGVSAELSTPVLLPYFGRPRLFLHGDIALALDSNEGLANEGNPGKPVVPPIMNFPVLGVPNQGAAIRAAVEPLVLSAGMGLSFNLELWGRPLRIKPSIEWQWQEDKIRTLFGAAAAAGIQPDFCTPCRTVFGDSTTIEGYHSLGPGLEVEVDAARTGDMMITLYGATAAYRLLSNSRIKQTLNGVWMTDGVPSGIPDATISSVYERERWHYRFSVGIRFLWLPE